MIPLLKMWCFSRALHSNEGLPWHLLCDSDRGHTDRSDCGVCYTGCRTKVHPWMRTGKLHQ